MDVKNYLKLQEKRSELKLALQNVLVKDATTVIRKYEKLLKLAVEKNIDNLSTFNVKAVIEDFSEEMKTNINATKYDFSGMFKSLWEAAKESLDVKIDVDYAVLPVTAIDNYKIIAEIGGIIEKYRKGEITDLRMKRLVSSRIRKPAHVANTIVNTQIAGFDNLASKAVADLAMLNKAMYFGPATNSEISHDLCIKLKASNRLYTEAEIKTLSNGQGLLVLIYCGGFNCVHEWVWVDENWEEVKDMVKN